MHNPSFIQTASQQLITATRSLSTFVTCTPLTPTCTCPALQLHSRNKLQTCAGQVFLQPGARGYKQRHCQAPTEGCFSAAAACADLPADHRSHTAAAHRSRPFAHPTLTTTACRRASGRARPAKLGSRRRAGAPALRRPCRRCRRRRWAWPRAPGAQPPRRCCARASWAARPATRAPARAGWRAARARPARPRPAAAPPAAAACAGASGAVRPPTLSRYPSARTAGRRARGGSRCCGLRQGARAPAGAPSQHRIWRQHGMPPGPRGARLQVRRQRQRGQQALAQVGHQRVAAAPRALGQQRGRLAQQRGNRRVPCVQAARRQRRHAHAARHALPQKSAPRAALASPARCRGPPKAPP